MFKFLKNILKRKKKKEEEKIEIGKVYEIRNNGCCAIPVEVKDGWVKFNYYEPSTKITYSTFYYDKISSFLRCFELGIENPFFREN